MSAAVAADSSKKQQLPNIGDVFNPYGMFNGIWVPESLLRCLDISASAKLLYGRLARFAGKDGRCFPSVPTLAVELGMTDRQVQRLIGQLCGAGFLRKDAQYRRDGSQTANTYLFLYHASLAPVPAIEPNDCHPPQTEKYEPELRGDKNVTGDKNVIPGVTAAAPLEESQLNSDLPSSSNSVEPTNLTTSAADPNPDRYPRSAARFRSFFPRTTTSVMARILRAILETCPHVTDEDIAAAVYIERDQKSPGLWVHTMPEAVQKVSQQRIYTRPRVPKCKTCSDAGVVWDDFGRVSWCPVDCEAAEVQRREDTSFVAEWNAHVEEQVTGVMPRNRGAEETR